MHETHEIATPDGACTAHVFLPEGAGPFPAVLFYMDGPGLRPALFEMGERLAAHGYYVLMPDLYYRGGPYVPFDLARAFGGDDQERARIIAKVSSVTHVLCNRDTDAFLDFLAAEPRATPRTGTVGYCMGGGLALTAAGRHPERVVAAASFHGARLASDAPDSPHLLAAQIRAEVYVGVAGIDAFFTPEEKARLEAALTAGGVRHEFEVYEGARHGFAVAASPVHDAAASERHWRKLLALYARALAT